jgi:hypothetical protein
MMRRGWRIADYRNTCNCKPLCTRIHAPLTLRYRIHRSQSYQSFHGDGWPMASITASSPLPIPGSTLIAQPITWSPNSEPPIQKCVRPVIPGTRAAARYERRTDLIRSSNFCHVMVVCPNPHRIRPQQTKNRIAAVGSFDS